MDIAGSWSIRISGDYCLRREIGGVYTKKCLPKVAVPNFNRNAYKQLAGCYDFNDDDCLYYSRFIDFCMGFEEGEEIDLSLFFIEDVDKCRWLYSDGTVAVLDMNICWRIVWGHKAVKTDPSFRASLLVGSDYINGSNVDRVLMYISACNFLTFGKAMDIIRADFKHIVMLEAYGLYLSDNPDKSDMDSFYDILARELSKKGLKLTKTVFNRVCTSEFRETYLLDLALGRKDILQPLYEGLLKASRFKSSKDGHIIVGYRGQGIGKLIQDSAMSAFRREFAVYPKITDDSYVWDFTEQLGELAAMFLKLHGDTVKLRNINVTDSYPAFEGNVFSVAPLMYPDLYNNFVSAFNNTRFVYKRLDSDLKWAYHIITMVFFLNDIWDGEYVKVHWYESKVSKMCRIPISYETAGYRRFFRLKDEFIEKYISLIYTLCIKSLYQKTYNKKHPWGSLQNAKLGYKLYDNYMELICERG